jgi:hypothetical protein
MSIQCSLRLEVVITRLAAEVLRSKCICTHSGSSLIHSAPLSSAQAILAMQFWAR